MSTDPFEGKKKMLLSEKPIYNIFYSDFLFPLIYPLDSLNILVRKVQESGRRHDILTTIPCDLFNQWKLGHLSTVR